MDSADSFPVAPSGTTLPDAFQSSPIPPLPLPPLPMDAMAAGHGFPLEYSNAVVNRVWTVFVVFLAAFAAFIVVNVICSGLITLFAVRDRQDLQSMQAFLDALSSAIVRPGAIIVIGLAGQITLLACAVIAAIVSPEPFAKRLRLNRSILPLPAYPLVMMGALAISILYSQLLELLHVKSGGAVKMLDELLRSLTPMQTVAAVLVLGITPGFAEEWLFRGYIQTRLSRAWGRWPAIAIAAALFGLMHMDLWQSPFAALFGVYLGYVAEKSDSIRPTMACHMFTNSVQILLATVLSGLLTPAVQMAIVICCVVALPVSIVYLRFFVKPPADQGFAEALPPLAQPA